MVNFAALSMVRTKILSRFSPKKAEKNSVSLANWDKIPNFVSELARKGGVL